MRIHKDNEDGVRERLGRNNVSTEKDSSRNYEFKYLNYQTLDSDVFQTLKQTIFELPKKSVLLFDSIDYLFTNHDFDLALVIIQLLRDMALWKNLIVLIPINKKDMNEYYWKILEKEGIELNLLEKTILSNIQLETLRFIHLQNHDGFKPIFSNVCKNQNFSKPRCKRILDVLFQNKYIEVGC